MSNVALSGNASGTGTFTIESPATNTDRTLTLPDSTGTVLNDQSNIEAQVKTATNATGSAPIYSCRAWVNFNGTGTVAIRASGNVTSITDNGVGDYTVNFTTALQDANYSTAFGIPQGGAGNAGLTGGDLVGGTRTTTAMRIRVSQGTSNVDVDNTCVNIFR